MTIEMARVAIGGSGVVLCPCTSGRSGTSCLEGTRADSLNADLRIRGVRGGFVRILIGPAVLLVGAAAAQKIPRQGHKALQIALEFAAVFQRLFELVSQI